MLERLTNLEFARYRTVRHDREVQRRFEEMPDRHLRLTDHDHRGLPRSGGKQRTQSRHHDIIDECFLEVVHLLAEQHADGKREDAELLQKNEEFADKGHTIFKVGVGAYAYRSVATKRCHP